MKLLDFEVNLQRPKKKDLPSITNGLTVENVKPSSKPISKIPKLTPKVLTYHQNAYSGRGSFTGSVYDLSEIGKVEDVEALLRQSFKKKLGLMFKEGLDYSGANKKTLQYIKTRMAQIAQASGIPPLELMKRVGHSLIRVSNAFLVKVRDEKASGGKIRKDPKGKTLKPVAGYFPAAPETMRVSIDNDTGKVVGWRQLLPNGLYKDFKVDDVVHFTIDKREGFIWGVPTTVPVIDDIRALRQIEENVELLLYQHLFPIFQYIVGTENAPAGYTEEGEREIDAVEEQIKLMPTEGAIVTPERHEIRAIGAEGRAVRAEGYLDHFKKRVIAGLGISSVDLGDGETANRATARTMSRALVDTVKDIQESFRVQWDYFIIQELLLESTFGDDVLDEANMVHLTFAEIDIDSKIEREAHNLEMFKGYAITYDELRALSGREPIIVPEDPHDQDLKKYPEWAMTYWKLIEEPLNLIRAVDEPFSAGSMAAAEARSLGITGQHLQQAGEAKLAEEKRAAGEDRQTKIAVAKARPKPTTSKKDNFITPSFDDLKTDIASLVNNHLETVHTLKLHDLLSHMRTWAEDTKRKFITSINNSIRRGFTDETGLPIYNASMYIDLARNQMDERISYYLDKLIHQIVNQYQRRVADLSPDVRLQEVRNEYITEVYTVFDALKYRTRFLWDTEIKKGYQLGKLVGFRYSGESAFVNVAHADCCERCSALDGNTYYIQAVDVSDLPPHHPGCRCHFKKLQITTSQDVSDAAPPSSDIPKKKKGKEAVKQPDPALEEETAVCPLCGRTAMWKEKEARFYCIVCRKSFTREEIEDTPIEDGKLESCVLQVKKSLRKQHPDWSAKKVKTAAFAVCNDKLK